MKPDLDEIDVAKFLLTSIAKPAVTLFYDDCIGRKKWFGKLSGLEYKFIYSFGLFATRFCILSRPNLAAFLALHQSNTTGRAILSGAQKGAVKIIFNNLNDVHSDIARFVGVDYQKYDISQYISYLNRIHDGFIMDIEQLNKPKSERYVGMAVPYCINAIGLELAEEKGAIGLMNTHNVFNSFDHAASVIERSLGDTF